MIPRIGLAAAGANADGAHMTMPQKNLVHLHTLHLADAVPGFFNLPFKLHNILRMLGFFFHEPALDFRIGV